MDVSMEMPPFILTSPVVRVVACCEYDFSCATDGKTAYRSTWFSTTSSC